MARDHAGQGATRTPVDASTTMLELSAGERWALDHVRRRGERSFIALMTVVAVAATVIVIAGASLFIDGLSDRATWTRSLVFAVVTPIVVAPPILFVSARLVARLDEASRMLQASAVTDPLTGVANRRGFFLALDALAGRDDVEVGMLDVDDFKAINDEGGHQAGDTALCLVATWLRETVGERGTVGRLGGDEFAYVASAGPGLPTPGRRVFRLDGTEFTVSVGCAVADDGDLHAALLAADAALYRHKQTRPRRPIVRTDDRDDQDE